MITPINPTDSTQILTAASLAIHLRLGTIDSDETTLLNGYILAAQSYAERIRGESFSVQTFVYGQYPQCTQIPAWYGVNFGSIGSQFQNIYGSNYTSFIRLPLCPIISITGIQYYDFNNSIQTLNSNAYTSIIGKPTDILFNANLPQLYTRPDAVKITFSAGYDGTNTILPNHVIQAVKLLAADWYRNRERLVEGRLVEIPLGGIPMIDRLLTVDRYRG